MMMYFIFINIMVPGYTLNSLFNDCTTINFSFWKNSKCIINPVHAPNQECYFYISYLLIWLIAIWNDNFVTTPYYCCMVHHIHHYRFDITIFIRQFCKIIRHVLKSVRSLTLSAKNVKLPKAIISGFLTIAISTKWEILDYQSVINHQVLYTDKRVTRSKT